MLRAVGAHRRFGHIRIDTSLRLNTGRTDGVPAWLRDVPVRVRVYPHAGGVVLHLWLTDLHRVTPVGAAPKGLPCSQLSFHEEDTGRWHRSVTIDV